MQWSKAPIRQCGWLAGLALACSCQVSAATTAAQLRTLLESKQAQAAFDAAVASDDSLGEPEFDFYFGIAALETGHSAEAVLALERFTLRFPENLSARFHLGRAYFAAGEDDAAEREFAGLQNQKGEIGEGAARYLGAIQARKAKRQSQWSLYAEGGLGYDSNITTGIDSGTQPMVPGFGTLPIQPDASTGVAAADGFVFIGVGVNGSVPLDTDWRLLASLNVDSRTMLRSENAMFNQQGLRADGGLQWESGPTRYRALAGYSMAWLDGASYVNTPSLVGEVAHQLAQSQQIALNLQWAAPRYSDGCSYFVRDKGTPCVANQASDRDADVLGFGLGWSYQAGGAWAPMLSMGLSSARERNVRGNESLSRRIDNLRAGLSVQATEDLGLSAGLGWQRSLYADKYPVADTARDDRQFTIDASASYRLSKLWLLRGEFASTRQDSNIGLYGYRRNLFSVALRRAFN